MVAFSIQGIPQEGCCADHVQQKEKATKVVHLRRRTDVDGTLAMGDITEELVIVMLIESRHGPETMTQTLNSLGKKPSY